MREDVGQALLGGQPGGVVRGPQQPNVCDRPCCRGGAQRLGFAAYFFCTFLLGLPAFLLLRRVRYAGIEE